MALIINEPIHVATLGYITFQPLGWATDGFLFEGDTEVLDGWYVRLNETTEILGPFPYKHAVDKAKTMSTTPGLGNLAQLCTYQGIRPGDPVTAPVLRVVYIYLRGKPVAGGKRAEYHSRRKNAPNG